MHYSTSANKTKKHEQQRASDRAPRANSAEDARGASRLACCRLRGRRRRLERFEIRGEFLPEFQPHTVAGEGRHLLRRVKLTPPLCGAADLDEGHAVAAKPPPLLLARPPEALARDGVRLELGEKLATYFESFQSALPLATAEAGPLWRDNILRKVKARLGLSLPLYYCLRHLSWLLWYSGAPRSTEQERPGCTRCEMRHGQAWKRL